MGNVYAEITVINTSDMVEARRLSFQHKTKGKHYETIYPIKRGGVIRFKRRA